MFSYRHAFHAGNHADVLKHTALIAVLQYLLQKDTPITVVDTHAGAGLYRLDGDYAQASGEVQDGLARLTAFAVENVLPEPLGRYLELVQTFNRRPGSSQVYPGSPFIAQHLLRPEDRLKLFELHPTDARLLEGHVRQLDAGRQVAVLREDGFEGVRRLLPPPSRRGLLFCDPSYELKNDYARVAALLTEAIKRFATGTAMIWYPAIPRPESHDLPRRLKAVAAKAGRPWLHCTLTVKSAAIKTDLQRMDGSMRRPGLPGSGLFLVNPPHTLEATLREALPVMAAALGQDRHAGFTLEAA